MSRIGKKPIAIPAGVEVKVDGMQISDTIADMLTRIRNASAAKHDSVDVPASNVKKAIAQILLDEGYISGFQVEEDGKQGVIHITLKYGQNKSQVISGIRRVSKPGFEILLMPFITCALFWPYFKVI